MLLDPSYLVFLQTLAASIYADGDSYHRCRACMCGRDYYTHIHFAMDYADYLSNMFLSSEWRGHYPYYREDCRDYCDDIFFLGLGTSLSLSLWCILLVCSYTIVCCMGLILLGIVYPWAIKKNYTLRWRRLLLHGGQSYRTILLCFAWLLPARPLYIECFCHMPLCYV